MLLLFHYRFRVVMWISQIGFIIVQRNRCLAVLRNINQMKQLTRQLCSILTMLQYMLPIRGHIHGEEVMIARAIMKLSYEMVDILT